MDGLRIRFPRKAYSLISITTQPEINKPTVDVKNPELLEKAPITIDKEQVVLAIFLQRYINGFCRAGIDEAE